MSEVLDKARLVPALDREGVMAIVARSEIEEAFRSGEDSLELVLDVTRREGSDVEAHALRFVWETNELGELLQRAEDDEITLVFDGAELQKALGQADVEAHGLREKALVLTVAIAAAGGVAAATPASAAGGSSRVAASAPPQGPQHPAEGTGFIATPGLDAARPAPPRGPQHPAEGTGLIATPGVDAAQGGGSGLSVSGADATTGVIAGGAVLLITAVGFAARGQRRHTVRPA